AQRLILPPTASFGLFDIVGAFQVGAKLRAPDRIEGGLPPELARRFTADAALLKQAPAHYDRWKPAVAGLVMVGDFRRQSGLDPGQPLGAIRSAAARAGVRAQAAATYPAIPLMKTVAGELSTAVNEACLADALQEIEAGAGRVRAAAAAWASGDVAGALAAERGYERCVAALPDGAALARRTMADNAAALAAALRAGGKTVAVVQLRTLVAQGGVLDRLRSAGFTVRTPGEE